jgi:hypothetical protein
MVVRLSTLRDSRPLPPGRFHAHISVTDLADNKAIVRLEGICQLKKFSDLIGIRTRGLPACSTVPRLFMLLLSPLLLLFLIINVNVTCVLQSSNGLSSHVGARATGAKCRPLPAAPAAFHPASNFPRQR